MNKSLKDEKCNGWANWETWSVAVWLLNDETCDDICRKSTHYDRFVKTAKLMGLTGVPEGPEWDDPKINVNEINENVFEYESED